MQAVAPNGGHWSARLAQCALHPAPGDAPLLFLAQELSLSDVELLTVALAAGVEEDAMIGRTLAYLQAPIGGSRPTCGLIAATFADLCEGNRPLDLLLTGNAARSGLLTLIGEAAPLPERSVAVPLPLCLALSGRDGAWPGVTLDPVPALAFALPAGLEPQINAQTYALRNGACRALVVRTGSQLEGRAVAGAVAHALNCRPAWIEVEPMPGLGPWLRLRRLIPVFTFDLAPGERKMLPVLPLYNGPVLVVCGPDGSIETSDGGLWEWRLPLPAREEREALWQEALGADVEAALATDLAYSYRHGSGRIAQLGRLARYQAHLANRDAPTRDDVVMAVRTGDGAGLNALAQSVPAQITDDALVLAPELRQELELLLLRCRNREELVEGLGASSQARYCPGVRALLVGPSGTGKTLAAGWLATRLGLPLYRVDLASVTSKYIGETEKNLAQLLARAEQAEVVLLFDEADALFGKRTDVKEANDRFANAQTNYLLQRIETFDGIALLTSNSRSRFDAAFARRLDMIIEFALPGPDERRDLWQSHLGTGHDLSQREINQLSALIDVGGGHIRNAVLTAAVLAQSQTRSIALPDVVQGIQGEYRKLGRQLPAELLSNR